MVRIALALLSLLTPVAIAAAAPASIVFDGEELVRKHEQANAKAGIVEFVPAGESLDGWTQLVGFHAFFDNPGSPKQAGETLTRLTEKRYPGSMSRLRTKGDEALVDFVLKVPNGDVVECNVFKYGRGPGGRGIVAFQYARRFRGFDPQDARVLCGRWMAETARFDLSLVRAAFKGPAAAASAKVSTAVEKAPAEKAAKP
ncbi:MAG TPA: hypothetical protein VF744_10370 [Beijerinckiaceae bacterium]|jgi:hypothetical protein